MFVAAKNVCEHHKCDHHECLWLTWFFVITMNKFDHWMFVNTLNVSDCLECLLPIWMFVAVCNFCKLNVCVLHVCDHLKCLWQLWIFLITQTYFDHLEWKSSSIARNIHSSISLYRWTSRLFIPLRVLLEWWWEKVDTMVQTCAEVCPQPRGQVLWNLGANGRHCSCHLVITTDGRHQASCCAYWWDRHLQDCHNCCFLADTGPRITCKLLNYTPYSLF